MPDPLTEFAAEVEAVAREMAMANVGICVCPFIPCEHYTEIAERIVRLLVPRVAEKVLSDERITIGDVQRLRARYVTPFQEAQ